MNMRAFSQACQRLYAPGLNPACSVDRCFAFIKALVPAELVVWALLEAPEARLQTAFDQPQPGLENAMEAFGVLMSRYSLYNFDPSMNEGRPFCRSQFYSARQFRDTAIYQEVYRALGLDNHCAVHVPAGPGEILFFGLERSGGPDFSGEERTLLEFAQPHLANIYALARLQEDRAVLRVEPALLNKSGLTPREAEILFWITEGKSNPEIAALLKISLYTVKDHVAAIFNKTGVSNRVAAIVWARDTCAKIRKLETNKPRFITVPAHVADPPVLAAPLQSGIFQAGDR